MNSKQDFPLGRQHDAADFVTWLLSLEPHPSPFHVEMSHIRECMECKEVIHFHNLHKFAEHYGAHNIIYFKNTSIVYSIISSNYLCIPVLKVASQTFGKFLFFL